MSVLWPYHCLHLTSCSSFCLSCTTLPLSLSDFMHVFLWPHVCHARPYHCLYLTFMHVFLWPHVCHSWPYHCLYLTSCLSFCDLMSFTIWLCLFVCRCRPHFDSCVSRCLLHCNIFAFVSADNTMAVVFLIADCIAMFANVRQKAPWRLCLKWLTHCPSC